MKKIIHSMLAAFDLELRRVRQPVPGVHCNSEMIQGVRRFKSLGLPIRTIIDVGAAAGSWSVSAHGFWPAATYLLFEPLIERKSQLEMITTRYPNMHYIPYAAGNGPGNIEFAISEDLDGSGIASVNTTDANIRSVEVTSIDIEVNRFNLAGPFIIKLDTHGFEVAILDGCKHIMDSVSLFIIECYGFKIADNSLLFWEMCRHMAERGFRLFDIVDVMNRPNDGAFWQCDAFFVRDSNSIFKANSYL